MSKPKRSELSAGDFFQPDLDGLLDQRQGLYKLANTLPWDEVVSAIEPLYSEVGRPGLPVRLLAGLLLLKHLENLSDERVCEAWVQNPYYQYFCGEDHFQWRLPCDPSELVRFRQRIGVSGVQRLLELSLSLHRGQVESENELVADTTVQESAIAFPTDTRLHVDCIEALWRMGDAAGVSWRRRYTRTVPKLLRVLRTRSNRLVKDRRKARNKLKTIAGRLLRDFKRRCGEAWRLIHAEKLSLIKRVLSQKKHDKNKVYSLHDPSVLCIAKGKVHKKYEFGRKASLAMLRDSGVIVSAVSFADNLYDGDTLEDTLALAQVHTGKTFKSVLVDRGYRGQKRVGQTDVLLPGNVRKSDSYYQRKKQRKRYARRAAIEPVIGHLKFDHRLIRCFLKGAVGSAINLILASAAWNLKLWLNAIFCALIQWATHTSHGRAKPLRMSLAV